MKSVQTSAEAGPRSRRKSSAAIRESLRELGIQLPLLNHHVAGRLDLRDVDLDCLDILDLHGPLSPTALARRIGLHPATVTGVLDRLERGGWVSRDRDPGDRRAVVVRARRDRSGELLSLYAGMNSAVGRICASYQDGELDLLAGFLRRVADAGREASDELSRGDEIPGGAR